MTSLLLYRLALRLVACAVPRTLRTEWRAEWKAELWYMAEAGAAPREIAAFCWGAVEDARSLRQMHLVAPVRAAGSARACVGWVGAIAVVCFALAQVLPAVRVAATSPIYRNATDSVLILPDEAKVGPMVPLSRVRAWQRRRQHLFTEFAFYAPVVRTIHLEQGTTRPLTLARASANVLQILGAPVLFAQEPRGVEPLLMLSQTAWRRDFRADETIFGQVVKVGSQRVRVGGLVPDEAAPAGGRLDGWILLPETDSMPETTGVYLLGRLSPSAEMRGPQWEMTVPGPEGDVDYSCRLLPALRADVWKMYLFAVFLALLALPATTSLSLGEYAPRPANLPWLATLRRWVFLTMKIACALPAIYFAGLIAAYAMRSASPYTPQYIQMVTTFSMTLFALRWALRDQRRRCPVCLALLTCPARVGEPSRNFLAWNGTELICAGGHGFMHVPEMATSWFGTQRWLHLDPSWSGLFLGPVKALDL
jgi:hypothetical protein